MQCTCQTIYKEKSVGKLYMKTALLEKAASVALAASRYPSDLQYEGYLGTHSKSRCSLSGSGLHSQAFKILRKSFTGFLSTYFLL